MNEETTNTPEVSTPEPDSLRGALESAFEATASAPAEAEAPKEAPAEGETQPTGDRPRAPNGRFVKQSAEADGHGAPDAEAGAKAAGAKAPSAPAAEPVVVKVGGEAPPPVEPVAVPKPPASWKPAAREAWAMLPDHVRAEILRREGETSRVLNETAEARKSHEAFRQVVAPYENVFRAEGVEPIKAVANVLQTVHQLKFAPRPQAAQVMAQVIRAYNIPIEALDAALAGQPVPQAQQGPVQDPRVDQLLAQIEAAKQQAAQSEAAAADAAVQEFGADKEFFDDVREDMADLIEVAARRGQKLDLETAYRRALSMNEEISAVMRQREEAKAAANARASTTRAKVASSSVKTVGPAPRANVGSGSLRDALESAWEDAAG